MRPSVARPPVGLRAASPRAALPSARATGARMARVVGALAARAAGVALALIVAAGCGGERARAGAMGDSVAVLTHRLADAEQGLRQRDQLAGELAQTARLVDAIDSTLAGVPGLERAVWAPRPEGGEAERRPVLVRPAEGGAPVRAFTGDPWAGGRDTLLARVDAVARLLADSRARVAELERRDRTHGDRLAGYRATIAELEASAARQRARIAALEGLVDSLRMAGRRVAGERDAARDTLGRERRASAVVYWVAASRGELVRRGVATEEGTRRFVVAGRRVLVPARRLDPAAFARADARSGPVIRLPHARRPWRVVSRHDPALLEPQSDGTLRVREPARFWAPSRWLVIQQD